MAVGENKALTAGLPTTFTFGSSGVDDYVIKPLNSASGDTMTITPYQVPKASFSAANFSTLECVPYKDFNSGSPVCVEIERDCFGTDGCNFLYTAQLDFKIDPTGIPANSAGIGGPRFLGLPGFACPTSGFNQDILVTYIGAAVDPLKGSGSGGGSCWVAAFDPTAAPVAAGVTVGFDGFFGLSTTTNTPVNPGSTEPLNFTYTTSSGTPITDLHWCKSFPNSPPTCNDGSATGHWVAFATFPVGCANGAVVPSNTGTDVAGKSNLQNLGGGSYRFNWQTSKTSQLGTCVTVFTQFDTGKFVFPNNFIYKKQ